jgi:heparan-alpha-glucosaminide N-acetyltransferase
LEPKIENQTEPAVRIKSIDVFRGLTIFIMIFVNDLASIKNIPAWMEHMPADTDGMTFVDIVFPAFLFIVGMSIPFAVKNRLKINQEISTILKHILIRTSGLLVLGVLMVNIGSLNEELTGMNRSLWMLLVFIGAILVWNNYPKRQENKKYIYLFLRITGILLLIFLAFIFRAGTIENPVWLQTKWWGILGLIGWAYLAASLVYIWLRNYPEGIAGFLFIFILLFIAEKSGALAPINFINEHFISLGSMVGAHAAMATTGVLFSILFFDRAKTLSDKIKITSIVTILFFLAGYFLRPLYGISKIYATPTWVLYSSAICCLLFLFLYWLIDIKNISRWSNFLKPAGTNPLLAYILPSIVYAVITLFGITFLSEYFGEGIIGIIRSILFSLIILWITSVLTSLKIQLRL